MVQTASQREVHHQIRGEPPAWRVSTSRYEKTLLRSQSRRNGFGNLVAKHPPFSFISPYFASASQGLSEDENNTDWKKEE